MQTEEEVADAAQDRVIRIPCGARPEGSTPMIVPITKAKLLRKGVVRQKRMTVKKAREGAASQTKNAGKNAKCRHASATRVLLHSQPGSCHIHDRKAGHTFLCTQAYWVTCSDPVSSDVSPSADSLGRAVRSSKANWQRVKIASMDNILQLASQACTGPYELNKEC
jgi:hypothetical protein